MGGKKDQFVLDGAKIKCVMGDKAAKLMVTANFRSYSKKKKIATARDCLPTNIFPQLFPFGTCKPYKAVPPPGCFCTYIPTGPWRKPYSKKKIGGVKPLLGGSILMCGRVPGGGIIKIEETKQKKHTDLEVILRCPKCKKEFQSKAHKPEAVPLGEYNGSGIELGDHIALKVHGCEGSAKPFYNHPFFYSYGWKMGNAIEIAEIKKSGNRYGIQAHHLICSDAVKGNKVHQNKIVLFGYSVNHHKNGVLLPSRMKVACHFKVPLHRGSHDSALLLKDDKIITNNNLDNVEVDFPIFNPGQELAELTYADAVIVLVDKILNGVSLDNACDPKKRKEQAEKLINDMDKQSQKIWIKVKNFKWSISADGFDYQSGGIGCYRENRLPDKRAKLKKEFKIKADDAESIARALYANKDKWNDITPCSRKHTWYINKPATWRMFEEREANHLEKKKFED